MKIIDWVKSLQGKSRWELQNEGTGLDLEDGRLLTAVVYDDYLIFSLVNNNLTVDKVLFMMEISAVNECRAVTVEMRIEEAINRVANE